MRRSDSNDRKGASTPARRRADRRIPGAALFEEGAPARNGFGHAVKNGKSGKLFSRSASDARVQVETDEVIAAIGARVRALRVERGLTLQGLAAETGLSVSMLSLLERGKTGPSIGTLVAIASVLGTRMSDLLGGREAADEPVCRSASQRIYATADGVRRRVLRSDPVRGIEIAINEYSARTASAAQPTTHEGYEFGVALEGTLEVTLNDEVYTIAKGDIVSYRSTVPHRIANPSRRKARALWVNLRQG